MFPLEVTNTSLINYCTLHRQGREDEARSVLQWLRGPHYNIEPEVRKYRELWRSFLKVEIGMLSIHHTLLSKDKSIL